MDNATTERISGWESRALITVVIGFGFLLIFPACICGCHFHRAAIFPALFPIAWGPFALFTYHDRKEQVVGWIAFLFAFFAVWIEYEGNLAFIDW